MRRKSVGSTTRRKTDRELVKYTRLTGRTTLAYTIFTGLILAGMVYTIYQQKGFNKKQLELYELSAIPQLFVVFDSLSFAQEHTVFYHVNNVGSSPALGVESGCRVTRDKENPFKEKRPGETQADVFPGSPASAKSRKVFEQDGTWYLHFRVDFQDLRGQEYYYKATYYLVFEASEDTASVVTFLRGMESSESGKLEP